MYIAGPGGPLGQANLISCFSSAFSWFQVWEGGYYSLYHYSIVVSELQIIPLNISKNVSIGIVDIVHGIAVQALFNTDKYYLKMSRRIQTIYV